MTDREDFEMIRFMEEEADEIEREVMAAEALRDEEKEKGWDDPERNAK